MQRWVVGQATNNNEDQGPTTTGCSFAQATTAVEECDATEAHSSVAAGSMIKINIYLKKHLPSYRKILLLY
jgi:hypothetical protein